MKLWYFISISKLRHVLVLLQRLKGIIITGYQKYAPNQIIQESERVFIGDSNVRVGLVK